MFFPINPLQPIIQSTTFNITNKEQTNPRETQTLPLIKPLFPSLNEMYSKMQNMRIIQKNLIYLIGLPKELAFSENKLNQFEYFGQYGQIKKIVVNKNKTYNCNNPNGPSYSCHITYSSISESSLAMLSLENATIDNHVFKASYGTTKYCSNFLRNTLCLNKDCLYLHSLADESDIISRDIMNNKEIFASQHIMAIELSQILTSQTKRDYIINEIGKRKTIFPNASTVYEKDIVKKYMLEHNINIDVATNNNDNIILSKNKIISIIGVDKLYNKKDQSRFDFVVHNTNTINDEHTIYIPDKISDFISENFKRSVLFQKEQDEVSQYYFAMSNKGKDAEDRWSSLISTLEMYSNFDKQMNVISNTNDVILVSKFNSA